MSTRRLAQIYFGILLVDQNQAEWTHRQISSSDNIRRGGRSLIPSGQSISLVKIKDQKEVQFFLERA